MVLFKRNNAKQEEGNIAGYPIVNEYKYLGTWINRTIGLESHVEKSCRKITYVTRKLTPCRMVMDTRFNVSLFRMLILPNIRMLGEVYRISEDSHKRKVISKLNRHFRSFCMLPWTCPDELVHLLIGDFGAHL
jgi:hypothetical protein